MARIDDAALVREEYAEPDRLATRFKPFREYHDRDLHGEIAGIIAALAPTRVLEVGAGEGEFTELLRSRVTCDVLAMDQSPMMTGRAASRGLDAVVGDVQNLPFPDATFDVVVANWMLYHLPDLPRGLQELHRVLVPGGHLVATTMGSSMLQEIWDLLPEDGSTPKLTFSAENAAEHLATVFASVRRVDLSGVATFPDRDAVVEYVESTLTRAHLSADLPEFEGPLQSRTTNAVFIAEKAD